MVIIALQYPIYGKVDEAVQLRLRVHSLRNVVLIILQEKVFERRRVFLFKRHHHLVAESKQHQLRSTNTNTVKKKQKHSNKASDHRRELHPPAPSRWRFSAAAAPVWKVCVPLRDICHTDSWRSTSASVWGLLPLPPLPPPAAGGGPWGEGSHFWEGPGTHSWLQRTAACLFLGENIKCYLLLLLHYP